MARASKTGVRGLFKEASGCYAIDLRWTDAKTGKRHRYRERMAPRTKLADAKKRAGDFLTRAQQGGWDPTLDVETPRTLALAIAEYVRWAEVNRPTTLRDRKSIGAILERHLGTVLLDDLTPFRVEGFKKARKDEGAGPATTNRAVAQLKHLCGLAVEWGWMRKPVADAIREMKMLREPPGRVRYLTADEGTRLMAALPARLRSIVRAALLSGMRLGELLALRPVQVDLVKLEITLTRTKTNRTRRVPVNAELAEVLRELVGAGGEYVFMHKGKPFSDSAVKNAFAAAVKKAGISDLHFHDLRHDFATALRRAGAGLDVIAALLGHTTLQMSTRYAHLGQSALHSAVSTLPRLPVAQPLPNAPTAAEEKSQGARHLSAVS